MARKRVANVLVDTLVAAGVKRIYGLAGDSLNGVTDSIRPRKDLQWVPVRHEETAAFAAGLTDLLDSGRAGQESPDAIRKSKTAWQHLGGVCLTVNAALAYYEEIRRE